jgi:hypothetical protein
LSLGEQSWRHSCRQPNLKAAAKLHAQLDTLRVRLIKIAARVVEIRTMIQIHLAAFTEDSLVG